LLTIALAAGSVLAALVFVSLALRRRRRTNRLLSLGSVSEQWLLLHRAEDH
jgi:hypothetical protein